MEKIINGKSYQVETVKSIWLNDEVIHDNQFKRVTGLHHCLIELDFKRTKLVLLNDLLRISKPKCLICKVEGQSCSDYVSCPNFKLIKTLI